MRRIDLHTHSIYSDGTLTPDELFAHAKDKKICALALTDHDTVDGLADAEAASLKYDIELLKGVELSSLIDDREIHLLGYFFIENIDILNNKLAEVKKIRENRNREIIKRLYSYGIDISYDDFNGIKLLTRTHIAKFLLDKKYTQSMDESFRKFLQPGCKTYVPKEKFSAEKSINLIKSAKGIAVLAHPLRYSLDLPGITALIKQLMELGLDGIETVYSGHNFYDEQALKRIADKYDLLITGGSDFHGALKTSINLGDGTDKTMIPYSIFEGIKNYLGLAL